MQIHTYIYLYIYENYLVKSFNVIKYHRDQIAMPSKLDYFRIYFFFFYCRRRLQNNPYQVTKGESETQGGKQKDSHRIQLALSLRHWNCSELHTQRTTNLLGCTDLPTVLPERGQKTGKV